MAVVGDQLKAFVERIERLEEEIRGLNSDKSDIYKEAKSNGFDPNAIRAVVRYRRDPDKNRELGAIVETYLAQLESGPILATRARTRSEAA